jgi:hypothetical protein
MLSNTRAPDALPLLRRLSRDDALPRHLPGVHLLQLKLPTILREYDKVARECAQLGIDHPGYLLGLVELELIDRERRVVERRIGVARLIEAAQHRKGQDHLAVVGRLVVASQEVRDRPDEAR